MKHITTSELQQQNKANPEYGYIRYCKGELDVHAAIERWLCQVTADLWVQELLGPSLVFHRRAARAAPWPVGIDYSSRVPGGHSDTSH